MPPWRYLGEGRRIRSSLRATEKIPWGVDSGRSCGRLRLRSKPQLETLSLDRFALLAMTESGDQGDRSALAFADTSNRSLIPSLPLGAIEASGATASGRGSRKCRFFFRENEIRASVFSCPFSDPH